MRHAVLYMMRFSCWSVLLLIGMPPNSIYATGQERVLAPNGNLVLDGVPPVAVDLAETAGRYGTYRDATIADWSPSRREMLISTRFGDTPQLHLVTMPGGARKQLTFFSDAVTAARFHPKQDDYFIFMKDTGGECYQLYRYEFATRKIRLMTDGKSRNRLGPFSSDGERLAYTSNRRNGNDMDLWVLDPDEARSPRLLTQLHGRGWLALDWSPDDKVILVKEEISINESHLWLVETLTGKRSSLFPRDSQHKVAIGEARFSKDGAGIYLISDEDSEFSRLTYLDLANRQKIALSPAIDWDVTEFDLAANGKRIAFVSNENGVGVLHVMDTSAVTEMPLPRISGTVSRIRWNRNGRDIGFVLASVRDPADCYSINVDTHELERWTFSESELPTDKFSPAESIQWKSYDGKAIPGFIYRPSAKFTGKRPVLIAMHAGPGGQSRPTFLGPANYFVNELGIAVIYPNVRGSIGYGRSFTSPNGAALRQLASNDIHALFEWIAAQPNLDANRVAVVVGTYTVHLNPASTRFRDRSRCYVELPAVDGVIFSSKTEDSAPRSEAAFAEEWQWRDSPDPNSGFDKQKLNEPIMLVAGRTDLRVPVSELQKDLANLKNKGVVSWYLLAANDGYEFQKKANRDFYFYALILFLERFLLK
jgi:dipeptidyl aminopeptidase/acylaminoacyl peptidase